MRRKIVQSDIKFSIRIALQYSFIVTGIFVLIFVIAQLFHLARFTELRFVNYVAAFFISYQAIKKVYASDKNAIEYFNGLMIGVLTSAFGQLWYAILFYIYLKIDHSFLVYIQSEMPQNIVNPAFSVAALLFLEGSGLSPIISLALMQYFKFKEGRWVRGHQHA